MKNSRFYILRCLTPILVWWLLMVATVKAESDRNMGDCHQPILNRQNSARDLLVQVNNNEGVAEITGVRINSTAEKLELILETASNERLIPLILPEDNNLIIDLPDAILALPEEEEFPATNPAPGITAIDINQMDATSVRIKVTGAEQIPKATVVASPENLVLSLTTERDETATETEAEPIDIIVTAEKKPENLQDVPVSITVLTESEIEDADITSFENIAGNIPNFTIYSGDSASSPFYSIRGLGNFNFLSREAAAFYIDDVPYDRIGFITTNIPDIAQVEVLRGPQSTLYGRNALSGVVNITTRRPTNELEFNGSIDYGSFNTVDLRGGFNSPIVKDKLFLRLSGNFLSRDGYIENSFLDEDVDEREGINGRAQLLWLPSDEWEVSFNTFLEDLTSNTNLVVVNDFDPSEAFEIESDVDNSFERNSDTQALKIAYEDDNFRATSITARRFSSSEQRSDADGSSLDLIVNTNDFESTVWSQEIRFQSPENSEQLEWLIGGYFESSQFLNSNDGFTFGADAAAVGFPAGANLTDGELEETILAGFAQVSYRPVKPLTLTTGIRFESFDSNLERLESTFAPPDGAELTTFSANNVEQDTDIWLPRFVAEYRFKPNLMVYGNIARGYRPSGVNFRGDETTLLFDAETAWNYELGIKSSWLDERLSANLALFYTDVADYQVLVTDSLSIGRIDNADVGITGAELELRANPVKGLDLIAGLGIADAEFSKSGDFAGNQVPFAPSLTYNLALQYRGSSGIFARTELQGLGKTFFNEDNSLSQDSYAIVNARLGYEFENVGIYLFANNIFDTEYFAQAFDFEPIGFLVTPGAPRTIGFQLKSQF